MDIADALKSHVAHQSDDDEVEYPLNVGQIRQAVMEIERLTAIIDRINERADVMRNQVGTGPAVADIRRGFDTIVQMTRERFQEDSPPA